MGSESNYDSFDIIFRPHRILGNMNVIGGTILSIMYNRKRHIGSDLYNTNLNSKMDNHNVLNSGRGRTVGIAQRMQ